MRRGRRWVIPLLGSIAIIFILLWGWTLDLLYGFLAEATLVLWAVYGAWVNDWEISWFRTPRGLPPDPSGGYSKGPLPELPPATAARIRGAGERPTKPGQESSAVDLKP
jgi:hypothetical protein